MTASLTTTMIALNDKNAGAETGKLKGPEDGP
jgi:hypothetical protein